MRVVMVTPDTIIDRRIILEAQSLVGEGNEVIIVACWNENLPEFEVVDGIKIQRIKYNGVDSRLKILYYAQNVLISFINKSLHFSNRVINKFSAFFNKCVNMMAILVRKFFNFLIRVSNFIFSGMSRLSHKVIYFFGKAGNKLILYGSKLIIKSLQKTAVLINKLTYWSSKLLGKLFSMNGFEYELMKVIEKYDGDIYHAHDLPVLRAAVEAAQKLKAKVIYDSHELYTDIGELPKRYKRVLSKVESKYIKKANEVITVNEFFAERLSQRYKIKMPHVIYNSTNRPELFNPQHKYDMFREIFKETQGKKIVLYQGWISLYRGLNQLVESARFLPDDICLVFMGYGSDREKLEQTRDKYSLNHKVFFMDAVSQEVLLQYTSSADAGIIPYPPVDLNHYYCSPNKLFEFIQAELPIIANDLPFLSKMINGHQIGVTGKLDTPESFAETIMNFFDSQDIAFYKNNLRKISNQFSWKQDEEKLKKIYRKIAVNN